MPPSRKEELVDAAMRVFYRHGFHGTGLDMVLQEAGVSRMTLYNHFKSKDELILAALHRRDEQFRDAMLTFVEQHAVDPVDRLLAVFDYHKQWFNSRMFFGCMFINASAEFSNPDDPIRRLAAEHKRTVVRYLRDLCRQAQLRDPETLAEHMGLLLEGAIVTAQIVGQSPAHSLSTTDVAHHARAAASILIDAARQ